MGERGNCLHLGECTRAEQHDAGNKGKRRPAPGKPRTVQCREKTHKLGKERHRDSPENSRCKKGGSPAEPSASKEAEEQDPRNERYKRTKCHHGADAIHTILSSGIYGI